MRSQHRHRKLVVAIAAIAVVVVLVLISAVLRSRSTATSRSSAPNTSAPVAGAPVAEAINSLDRILYSMNGPHEGAPHGVPPSFSWAEHPELGAVAPPAGMSAFIGWGQIYSDATNVQPANVRIELRNMETYVWSNTNHTWTRVQGTAHVDGAHYVENFAGNTSIPTDLRAEPDGGTSTGMTSGYNFHFWPAAARAALPNPADVGAVYTTVQARLILDDPNGPDNRSQARYLANTGADWWRTTTAHSATAPTTPPSAKPASPTSPPTGPPSTSTPADPSPPPPAPGPKPNSTTTHPPSTRWVDGARRLREPAPRRRNGRSHRRHRGARGR